MPKFFQCIGDDYRGYHVETVWASNIVWYVPATHRDDPTTDQDVVEAYRALLSAS